MAQEKKHITLNHLKYIKSQFKGVLESAEKLRNQTKDKESLVFLTDEQYINLVATHAKKQPTIEDILLASAVIPWSFSKLIYRFDEDVVQSVLDTELTGDIPKDILYRLPGWSIYVETPPISYFDGMVINGFYASISENDGEEVLKLVLNTTKKICFEIVLLIGATIKENIDKQIELCRKEYNQCNVTAEDIIPYLAKIVSLLIFICTQNNEISRRPTGSTSKRNGFIIENDIVINDVGVSIGNAIRLSEREYNTREGHNTSLRKSVRPHIRRAHWHGYWSGSKNSNNRKYDLKWIPPVPVAVREHQEITTTLHKIKI